MSILVEYPTAVYTAPLVKISDTRRQLYQVKWDWLNSMYAPNVRDMGVTATGEPRHSVPGVFRCGEYGNTQNGHYVKLNKAWQFFMFDLACLSVYGTTHDKILKADYDWLAKKFVSVFDSDTAFCNKQGFDNRLNYITGHIADGLPALYTLVCGGASLSGEVVGDKLKVDAFDGTKSPPDISTIDWREDPRVFLATTITDNKVASGYWVRKFPQYDGKDVPVPIIAMEPIYYPLKDLYAYVSEKKAWAYYP